MKLLARSLFEQNHQNETSNIVLIRLIEKLIEEIDMLLFQICPNDFVQIFQL